MKKLSILFIAMLCVLASCSKDDENSNNSSMEITINGVTFNPSTFNNTLISGTDTNGSGKRMDIRTNVDGGELYLPIANVDLQNPPEGGIIEKTYDLVAGGPNSDCFDSGNQYNPGIICDGAIVTYQKGTDFYSSVDILGSNDLTSTYIVEITDNDVENKLVSGNFNVVITEFFDDDKFLSISGTFEDLKYIAL